MLEQVREAGPVARLVAEADVVVHGDDRRRRIVASVDSTTLSPFGIL